MRTRSILAIGGAAAVAAAVGLSGAPVMAVPAATSVSEPSLAWALPHFAVGRQVGWLLSAAPKAPLPVKEIKRHFDKAFLAQVSPAQINKAFGQFPSRGPWRLVTLDAGTARNLLVISAIAGTKRLGAEIETDPHGLIGAALLSAEPALPRGPTSWSALDKAARKLAPDVGFEAATVGVGGRCDPLNTLAPSTARPLGSMFKLYVLGAVADAVSRGRISWHTKVALTARLRSIPSGSLQIEPLGTRYTVAQLAKLMISSSDNTAADELAALVGRSAVEAQVRLTSRHASLNVPFLRVRELAALKFDHYPHYAKTYLADSPAARLSYLRTVVDRLPLSVIEPTTADLRHPRDIDTIEWFASPSDLCAQFARLYGDAGRPGLASVSAALSINDGGIELPRAAWPLVWFKGGSETGVLTLGYLARSADGKAVVVVLELSDPSQAIPSSATLTALSIMHAGFSLAG
jgi:Beta-lactamase enzyme family/ORF 12 gene product N-terminal